MVENPNRDGESKVTFRGNSRTVVASSATDLVNGGITVHPEFVRAQWGDQAAEDYMKATMPVFERAKQGPSPKTGWAVENRNV